ncbi:hypothetical protein BG452_02535 [Streptomyces sp. CBMA123]|nr:hypothetical protein [Streptomyces sp. CBMA123]
MFVRRTLATATAASALAALMTFAGAGSASAAQDTFYLGGSEGAIDNTPGDGAASWVWAYAHDAGGQGFSYAQMEFRYTNGLEGAHTVRLEESRSTDLPWKVASARLCVTWTDNGKSCTDWHYYA